MQKLNDQISVPKDTKEGFLSKVAYCSQSLDFSDENKNVEKKVPF